ncbi:hypothetical protein [Blastococcus brunescens]|uniref:Uncharacterized protein n=1 Tax=Blastococcus brunescens TaxID=1564165 RepID=A0ABZ1B618_9ACTN|nr:hypothetical protein [Blastococcus sp. BMG 8361]WRL66255.1 hypothetical protein U6N30_12760 [Blastococcus sp. BMG 8361]
MQLPAGTTSAGLSVVLYNGSGGASYSTRTLPTVTAPADGPAVAVLDYPSNGIQNGSPDGVALVSDGTVLEFLSYEGTFAATNGPAAGTTSTDIGVQEAGSSLRGSRCPACTTPLPTPSCGPARQRPPRRRQRGPGSGPRPGARPRAG